MFSTTSQSHNFPWRHQSQQSSRTIKDKEAKKGKGTHLFFISAPSLARKILEEVNMFAKERDPLPFYPPRLPFLLSIVSSFCCPQNPPPYTLCVYVCVSILLLPSLSVVIRKSVLFEEVVVGRSSRASGRWLASRSRRIVHPSPSVHALPT